MSVMIRARSSLAPCSHEEPMDEIERSALDFFLALTVVGLLILALFAAASASMEWKRQSAHDEHVIVTPESDQSRTLSQKFTP